MFQPPCCQRDSRLDHLSRLHRPIPTSTWTDSPDDPAVVDAEDFPSFVEAANEQMANLWKDDRRVQVVRLTIQLAKMLGDPATAGLVYYPAIFFQLSDIISYLGQLVYDRLGR